MSSKTNNEATTGDSIKTPYKEQLDKAAERVKGPPAGTNEEPSETLLDKGRYRRMCLIALIYRLWIYSC